MIDFQFRWKEEPFDEMDSTLAVQQYIQQTIRKDPKGLNVYEKTLKKEK